MAEDLASKLDIPPNEIELVHSLIHLVSQSVRLGERGSSRDPGASQKRTFQFPHLTWADVGSKRNIQVDPSTAFPWVVITVKGQKNAGGLKRETERPRSNTGESVLADQSTGAGR